MTKTIADRVQARLSQLNISMRKASLDAGLSDAFIRNIISGKSSSPRGVNLTKLARVLQTTETWLLHGEGPETIHDAPSRVLTEEDIEFIDLWRNASDADRQVILALLRSRTPSNDQ